MYLSGMIMFVRMIVFVWYESIFLVRLCLVREYLSGMIVFARYDSLSGMIVFVLYEGICPVLWCLFGVYVRYDCICPI